MKLKINYIFSMLCLIVFLTSCNKTTPSSFWTDFHKDFIVTKYSDQGPWGGKREINWKSEKANTFTDKEIIEFAKKNEWKLVNRVSFSGDTLTKNSFSKLKNDDYSLDILNENILPKLKEKDSIIFSFKTSWLNVKPGNTDETFLNGFAVINSDGTELKVFHYWGE